MLMEVMNVEEQPVYIHFEETIPTTNILGRCSKLQSLVSIQTCLGKDDVRRNPYPRNGYARDGQCGTGPGRD
jgi:hypothetical protein